jgi:hypothetical protein
MLAFKCNDFTKVATGGQNNYSKEHATFINNLKAHQHNKKVSTCISFHLLLQLPKLHKLAPSAPFRIMRRNQCTNDVERGKENKQYFTCVIMHKGF